MGVGQLSSFIKSRERNKTKKSKEYKKEYRMRNRDELNRKNRERYHERYKDVTPTTCKILQKHHDDLKDDPERLTTGFLNKMIGVNCNNTDVPDRNSKPPRKRRSKTKTSKLELMTEDEFIQFLAGTMDTHVPEPEPEYKQVHLTKDKCMEYAESQHTRID